MTLARRGNKGYQDEHFEGGSAERITPIQNVVCGVLQLMVPLEERLGKGHLRQRKSVLSILMLEVAMGFRVPPLLQLFCLAAFGVVVRADVIADVSSSNPCCGPLVDSNAAIQIFWTQTQAYQDISISVPLLWTNTAPFDINAYLTTSTGAGTSPPPLASASFSATGSNAPLDALLFSGITLDAGTYYLTLYGTDPTGPVWVGVQPLDSTLSITTAPGVSISNAYQANGGNLNTGYAPASSFILNGNLINTGTAYQDVTIRGNVRGTVVPEPSTWPLTVGAGMILIWCRKLRQS